MKFKEVVTDNVWLKSHQIEGTLLKRSDQSKRYVDFYYRTGIICFKKAKEDLQPSKQILASKLIDVRMLND